MNDREKWLERALAFYADPETYHGVSFIMDPPGGGWDEDFSDDHGHPDYDRSMPGKIAREALAHAERSGEAGEAPEIAPDPDGGWSIRYSVGGHVRLVFIDGDEVRVMDHPLDNDERKVYKMKRYDFFPDEEALTDDDAGGGSYIDPKTEAAGREAYPQAYEVSFDPAKPGEDRTVYPNTPPQHGDALADDLDGALDCLYTKAMRDRDLNGPDAYAISQAYDLVRRHLTAPPTVPWVVMKEAIYLLHAHALPSKCPRWEYGIGDCERDDCDFCRIQRCIDELDRVLAQHSELGREECGWSLDDEDYYQTDCGTEFETIDFLRLEEMPSMKYCANCGRRIRDDSPAPDADEREDG